MNRDFTGCSDYQLQARLANICKNPELPQLLEKMMLENPMLARQAMEAAQRYPFGQQVIKQLTQP